jgi:hypothetical protein
MPLHLFRSSRDVILEEQGHLKGWTKTGKISQMAFPLSNRDTQMQTVQVKTGQKFTDVT